MQTHLGNFSHKSRAYLKTGWLITAGLIALYLGAIAPLENVRNISLQKATGLSEVATERTSFSLRSPNRLRVSGSMMGGVIGGVPGGVPGRAMMTVNGLMFFSAFIVGDLRSLLKSRMNTRNPNSGVIFVYPAAS